MDGGIVRLALVVVVHVESWLRNGSGLDTLVREIIRKQN